MMSDNKNDNQSVVSGSNDKEITAPKVVADPFSLPRLGLYIPPQKSRSTSAKQLSSESKGSSANSGSTSSLHKSSKAEFVIPCLPNTFGKRIIGGGEGETNDDNHTRSNNTSAKRSRDNVEHDERNNSKRMKSDDHSSSTTIDVNDENELANHLLTNIARDSNYLLRQHHKNIEENDDDDDDDGEDVFEKSMVDVDHEYKDHTIPINQIGRALLLGMGWQEGKPYGRSDKVIEPIQVKIMPKLAGLGSKISDDPTSDEPDSNKKDRDNNRISNSKPDKTDGNRLLDNQRSKSIESSRREQHDSHTTTTSPASRSTSEKRRSIKWLIPNIKVRIISKSLQGGKYYNTKGVVYDIPDMYTCSVKVPTSSGSKILEDITESMLETIIPKERNTPVICVAGKNRGKRGNMIERDRRKGLCYFQVTDENDVDYGQIISASFDDVCEYVAHS